MRSERRIKRSKKHPVLWALFLTALLFYTWAYCYLGAILIIEKNTVRTGQPQAAFIDAVYRGASLGDEGESPAAFGDLTSLFPQYTDGIVDPLFPWLMRAYANQPPDLVFEAGKWMNLILSGSLLLGLALVAARAFSFAGAAAMVLMGGFGIILERSAYFSPDAIYYLLIVLAWMCALSLIRQNHLWLYGVFGVLLGLSYLAKPLIWPVVLGFILVSLIRSVWVGFRARKDRSDLGLWIPANQWVGFAMSIAAFFLITGPRLTYAGKVFGDPFHSYQKYSIWFDTPGEAAQFQQLHSGAEALAEIPPEERPGISKFVREKGAAALLERSWLGALAQVKSSVLGRGGRFLIYSFCVFLTIASIHRWALRHQSEEVWQVRGTSARWMLLFLGIVGAITLFYSGVGNPVIPHNALTTSLFLPILVTFIWIAERYRRQLQRTRFARLVNRVYLGLMAGPIIWISVRIVEAVMAPV